MSVSQALATPVDEIMESSALAPRNGFLWSRDAECAETTRCARKSTTCLATGASYAMIVRALAEDNAELDKCDRVTIDSVRNHCGRHFPVQSVAKATYRDILERRARANRIDFIEGVATALTPIAFFETVMVKSYETLVDSDTRVDVNTGIVAAESAAVADRFQGLQPRTVGDEGQDGPDLQRGAFCCPAGDVGGDHREAG